MFRHLLVFTVLLSWRSTNAAFGGTLFYYRDHVNRLPLFTYHGLILYVNIFFFCMIRSSRPMTTTTEHKWQIEEEGFMCNVDYLDPVKNSPNGSPLGIVDSLALCKSRCEKNPKCQSIAYFSNSKRCSHFGAPCEHKIEPNKAISWTLIRNAGLPRNETPCIFALGGFGLNTHVLSTQTCAHLALAHFNMHIYTQT